MEYSPFLDPDIDYAEQDWAESQMLLNDLVAGSVITRLERREFMSKVAFSGTRLGLSMSHIFVPGGDLNPAQATFWTGAGLVQCRQAKMRSREESKSGGGIRGKVQKFSKQSRLRLMKLVAAIRKDELPIFITLTYPSEWPSDPKEWKRHLKNFVERMGRAFDKNRLAILWKLEPQKRGAPHYHLLIYGLAEVHKTTGWGQLLWWVSRNWYEVVGSGDGKHLQAGTRVEKIRSRRGAMFYASKYLSKVDHEKWEDLDVGRFWGVYFRDNLPLGEAQVVTLTDIEAKVLIRYMRKKAGMSGHTPKAISLFGDGDFWYERLPDMLYPAFRKSGLRDFMWRATDD